MAVHVDGQLTEPRLARLAGDIRQLRQTYGRRPALMKALDEVRLPG
jgi:hypothetical protein